MAEGDEMEADLKLQLQKAYLNIKEEDITMEELVKQTILRAFKDIKSDAEKHQVCKRKAVGCSILEVNFEDQLISHFTAINGPSGPKNKCTGIKGACGCSHAEPRAIMNFLKKHSANGHRGKTILLTTYSSCVNCANIIIDSGIIDAVAYEILAPHWSQAHGMLDRTIPHWNKLEIETGMKDVAIRKWLLGC